jgi:hypothetical protein
MTSSLLSPVSAASLGTIAIACFVLGSAFGVWVMWEGMTLMLAASEPESDPEFVEYLEHENDELYQQLTASLADRRERGMQTYTRGVEMGMAVRQPVMTPDTKRIVRLPLPPIRGIS